MSSAYGRPRGMLTLETLGALVGDGTIETVIVGFTDHYGRLMGKRFDAEFFLERHRRARHARLRLPADRRHGDGAGARLHVRELGARLRRRPPRARPRHAARRELARRRRRSCSATSTSDKTARLRRRRAALDPAAPGRRGARRRASPAMAATELEYYLFRTSYREAAQQGYRDLEPAGWYLEDYHILQGTRTEDFHAAVRRHLKHSGVPVESSKGEWGLGPARAERALRRRARDGRPPRGLQAVPQGGRRPAMGVSVTFMAKFARRSARARAATST